MNEMAGHGSGAKHHQYGCRPDGNQRNSRPDANEFSGMGDEEIIGLAKLGNETAMEYMLLKYRNFVRKYAGHYFIMGAENDDIVQEGMIGLFKAVRDFKAEDGSEQQPRQNCFRNFAGICVKRQIITAIKAAARRKHQPLNTGITFEVQTGCDSAKRIKGDAIENYSAAAAATDSGIPGEKAYYNLYTPSPEDEVIGKEELVQLKNKINSTLSKFEKKVLAQYLTGKGYREIAVKFGRTAKSIDNSLQRIRQKLRKIL